MTLTTDRLREIASGDAFICTQDDESVAMARELLANREAQPVAVPEYLTYLKDPIISNVLADDDNSPMANAARILAREVKFWRSQPLFTAPPAPAVPPGYRLQPISEYDAMCGYVRNDPPAPAVPDEISSAIRYLKETLVACNRFNYCADAVNRVEDACRAAMLAAAPEGGNDHDTRR